jgi:(p)ppGpp synthase/HD superfamily hydrolase
MKSGIMVAQELNWKSLGLVDRAIVYAVKAHGTQVRKGTITPYITHLFGVAVLLSRAGCPDEVIAAGILHDTIEDTGVTLKEIRTEFGRRVASLVKACSEPGKNKDPKKEKPWEERKEHTLVFLKTAPPDVRFVVLADKLNNIRAIAADLDLVGEAVWERFKRGRDKQKRYHEGLVRSLRDSTANEAYQELHRQFAREVKAVFGSNRGISEGGRQ